MPDARRIAPGIALLWACLFPLAAAQRPTQPDSGAVPPGHYIARGGWGRLAVERDAEGATRFAIEAVGANGHQCALDGVLTGNEARLDTDAGAATCRVRFTPVVGGMHVASTGADDACRYFCGMRAQFGGDYLRPAPGCADAALDAMRARFKALYDAKEFRRALALLSPAPQRCAATLARLDAASIRNDIAITRHHLGMDAACRSTLAPVLRDYPSESRLRDTLPPSDFDDTLPIARAAWHNAALCRAATR